MNRPIKNVTPGREASEPPPFAPPPFLSSPEAERRLARLRRIAWILDRLIPAGGQRRIGIDPLIGLIPGIGDWVAAGLSVYVLYEAACLGLPARALGRIAGNILVEAVVGTVPVAGDLFDFVFQANMRNLRIVEENYRPGLRPRSFARIWLGLAVFTLLLLALVAISVIAFVKLLMSLLS